MNLHLKQLQIFNFAKIKELVVDFSPGVTYLVGMNGSGKTTIINSSDCDDAIAAIEITRQFGCEINAATDKLEIISVQITIPS